jgi:hypothetical protein
MSERKKVDGQPSLPLPASGRGLGGEVPADPREERLQALCSAAYLSLDPSEALHRRVEDAIAQCNAGAIRRGGWWPMRPIRWAAVAGALGAAVLLSIAGLKLARIEQDRSTGPRAPSLVKLPLAERPAPALASGLPPGASPALAPIVLRQPVLPGTASFALSFAVRPQAESRAEEREGPRRAPSGPWLLLAGAGDLPLDRWEAAERRMRRDVPVRDDFVQVSFPRIAAISDRQIAEAVESYKREAGIVDARLSREVTLQQKATALSDLCQQLRADTGIHLEAGSSVADEKVTVFCAKQPLRDVMRQLSRPFGYTWLRSGKTGDYKYELVQDLRSQLLEEELRNRDRNAALIALDREMQRYRPYLGLSPDEALARAKTAPAADKRLLEALAATGWGPIQMYTRLSRRDLEALRAGQWLVFSEEPRPGEQPLPPDLARGVLQSVRNLRAYKHDQGYAVTSDLTDPRGVALTANPDVRAQIGLEMPQAELGQFTYNGQSGFFTPRNLKGGSSLFTATVNPLASGRSPATLKPENAAVNASLARDPAFRPRVSLQPRASCGIDLSPGPSPKRGGVPDSGNGLPRPEGSSRQHGDTENKLPLPASGRGSGGEVPAPKVTSADVLETLHRATGLPIVADYYTRLFKPEDVSVRNVPLFDAFNHLADAMHLRWTRDGGGSWIQFRSASFFNDRLKEVPNCILLRWSASRRLHGALTLDDLVEIAQLSDAQLDAAEMAEGARECWGLDEWRLGCYRNMRPHLRFLAQLTPAQRQESTSAIGLPFTRMSLAQQQQFVAFALGEQPLRSLEELDGAALRVDYSLPGGFQWGDPGRNEDLRWIVPLDPGPQGRRVLRLPVRERTREAALQALRRVDPKVREALWQERRRRDPRLGAAPPDDEAEIFPTKLSMVILYLPGTSNGRPIHALMEDVNLFLGG